MTLILAISWIVSGGFFGGLLYCLNRYDIQDEGSKICYQGNLVTNKQVFSLALINSILGIGGAFSVLLILITLDKFDFLDDSIQNQLFLFTISVVSGYGGRRFLNIVTSKLEKQIDEANKISQEAKEESKIAKEESKVAIEEATESLILTKAISTLDDASSDTDRNNAIKDLYPLLEINPTDRTLNLIAGRLLRRNKEYSTAIQLLTTYLDKKIKLKELDNDYADLIYNRACYRVLLANDVEKSSGSEKLIQLALADLKESSKISPENAIDATKDSDFSSIYNNAEFIKLTT